MSLAWEFRSERSVSMARSFKIVPVVSWQGNLSLSLAMWKNLIQRRIYQDYSASGIPIFHRQSTIRIELYPSPVSFLLRQIRSSLRLVLLFFPNNCEKKLPSFRKAKRDQCQFRTSIRIVKSKVTSARPKDPKTHRKYHFPRNLRRLIPDLASDIVVNPPPSVFAEGMKSFRVLGTPKSRQNFLAMGRNEGDGLWFQVLDPIFHKWQEHSNLSKRRCHSLLCHYANIATKALNLGRDSISHIRSHFLFSFMMMLGSLPAAIS